MVSEKELIESTLKTTKSFAKALNAGIKKVQELFDNTTEKNIVKTELTKVLTEEESSKSE